MGDLRPGDLRRPIGRIDDRADTGCICPVATNDADELLDIMSAGGEDRPARGSTELWRAERVRLLGGVVELVLDESHELGVSATPAIIGVQGDDEIRHEAKPLLDLHLRTGAGPFAHGALRLPLFALADDAAPLATVLDNGPKEADFGMCQVLVLRIMERRRRIQERRLYPAWHIFGRAKVGELMSSNSEEGG